MSELLRGTPVQYELKRANRFIMEFPSELGIESWKVQTSGRPVITINGVPIPYINTEYYVAGKYKWDPISVSLIDPIGPSTSQQVMEWVRLCAESVTGRMGYAATYKKDLIIKALDPSGIEVEKWVLYQTMITKASFGDNDHGNDELQKVTIDLQPDWCVLSF